MQKIKFLTLFASFFVWTANAQDLLGAYKSEIPYFQELITGGQYEEVPKTIEGHPFYYSRKFENGSVRINGITYSDVPLMYDCYRDQVLTFHPIYKQKLLINPAKVEEFKLADGSRFKYFERNSGYSNHGNGLYQVLNENEILVLSKHYKTTKSKREIRNYTAEFVEKKSLFLWKRDVFYSISKANQIADVLELEKKVLKKQMKSIGISFNTFPESYLVESVKIAESLTKELDR